MATVNIRGFNEIGDSEGLLTANRHDLSLQGVQGMRSRNGELMAAWTFVADNGDEQGETARITTMLEGKGQKIGERFLRRLGVASGFEWQLHSDLDQLLEQFAQNPPLRISGHVVHAYKIRSLNGGTWQYNVSKKDYDEHAGEKWAEAQLSLDGIIEAEYEVELVVKAKYTPLEEDGGSGSSPKKPAKRQAKKIDDDDDLPF